jgi:hypothetical protein
VFVPEETFFSTVFQSRSLAKDKDSHDDLSLRIGKREFAGELFNFVFVRIRTMRGNAGKQKIQATKPVRRIIFSSLDQECDRLFESFLP